MHKLSLSQFRAIFVDFDDTLCIYDRYRPTEINNENMYDIKRILNLDDPFADRVINEQLAWYLRQADAVSIKIYLVGTACTYPHMAKKEEWVRNNYKIKIINTCVNSDAHKVEMIKAVCDSKKYDLKDILYIEDVRSLLVEASDEGITACSPMEIVNYTNWVVNNKNMRVQSSHAPQPVYKPTYTRHVV